MTTRIFSGSRRMDAVAPDDRGLAYGDGLFETMRVHRGTVPWWDAHWSRLQCGAQRLRLRLPDAGRVREEAAALFAEDPPAGDGVLKLIVTRGSGGRGYAPSPDAEPAWLLSRHDSPPPAPADGLRVHWCETRLASQPLLAGIKHCNRLEQVLARAECTEAGFDEGLMCDHDGHVVAATGANLFVSRQGQWWTPMLDRCGIAGTCRARLLLPLQAREARLDRAAIEAADAVFLSNAVRGILPVARLGTRAWSPHPATAAARAVLARLHPAFALDLEHP